MTDSRYVIESNGFRGHRQVIFVHDWHFAGAMRKQRARQWVEPQGQPPPAPEPDALAFINAAIAADNLAASKASAGDIAKRHCIDFKRMLRETMRLGVQDG